MKFLLSSSAPALAAALDGLNTATVEAEFGDVVVAGSILTLAHHGARSGRPCPCSLGNLPNLGIEVVGLSHFDLDTLGGVMAILGSKIEGPSTYSLAEDSFWRAAAQVDVHGVHKLDTVEWAGELPALNAFWAWSEANRLYPPRDGSVADVTEFITTAVAVVRRILDGGADLLAAGAAWEAAKAALEAASFVDVYEGVVLLRTAEVFVNHLYGHEGVAAAAVVGFNPKTGGITVSLADPVEGFSCKDFAQAVWPDVDAAGNLLAGGHAGIAGSPRGKQYTLDDAKAVAIAMAARLG